MRGIITLAALLTLTLAWSAPVQAGSKGAAAFQSYCGSCHGPEANRDLKQLTAHAGSFPARDDLAQLIDPAPDTLAARGDEACNQHLRKAFRDQRFAWNIRRSTLFEIFQYLEGVQR